MKAELLLVVVVAAAALLLTGEAVWLELPSAGTKCVSEDIQSKVVVLADYYVIGNEEHATANVAPTISVKVTSPYGNNLHHEENATHGQFAFTTAEAGDYLACFWMATHPPGGKGATVGLDWKMGIAAKDWDSVAKKEKIEGLELELRKLEEMVQAILANLLYLKAREADMREVSEKTNGRVAWFSVFSLGVCIFVSLVQIWHLKRFFQKKKLI
nr:transmembrane emp24 domain-containing protein p24delta3-like [Ipomoea batatas]GME20857.1 transmembrane emp24 domain-containing protein p24delta3-like [Ipomoea batatas]